MGVYPMNHINNKSQVVYTGKTAPVAGEVVTINANSPLFSGIYHLQGITDGKMYTAQILIK